MSEVKRLQPNTSDITETAKRMNEVIRYTDLQSERAALPLGAVGANTRNLLHDQCAFTFGSLKDAMVQDLKYQRQMKRKGI
jgi:hypothetical protein